MNFRSKHLLLNKILFISLATMISSCIEQVDSVVKGYQDLIVVDGGITNAYEDYTIKLMHSTENIDFEPSVEIGATVTVTDNDGNTYNFYENTKGIYTSKKEEFQGQVGSEYKLNIKTKSGENYESSWCMLNPSSIIDRVYYDKKEYFSEYHGKNIEGLQIKVDGEAVENSYLRWDYKEDWKFEVQYPQSVVISEDNVMERIPVQNQYCWQNSSSSQVDINSFYDQNTTEIKDKDVLFIYTKETSRTNIRYSVKVEQHTISKEEFDYWESLKEAANDQNDLFGKQPYSLKGNVRNLNSEDRDAIGYFQVSGVSSERIFIDREDVAKLGLKMKWYMDECRIDTVLMDENTSAFSLYARTVLSGDRALYQALYESEMSETIVGLILVENACSDCSRTGAPEAPEFWTEE